MKTLWTIVKMAVVGYNRHRAPQLAAALAFYAIFALAPVLLIAVSVAERVLGDRAVRIEIVEELGDFVGDAGEQQIQTLVDNAKLPGGAMPAILAGVIMLFGATAVFRHLKESMNAIWEVECPRGAVWRWTRNRLLALLMVVVVSAMLVASLGASTAVSAVNKWAEGRLPIPSAALQWTNIGVSIVMISALFAGAYKWLPDIRVRWRDVLAASVLIAALFTLGKSLVGVYLGRSFVASAYGAAGSVIILLLWVYYSSMIFFFGAEFCCAQARHAGRHAPGAILASPAPAKDPERQQPPEGEEAPAHAREPASASTGS